MDNLINREAALAAVADAIADGRNVYRALAEVPVVEERHGKNEGEYAAVDQFVCSECGLELQGWYRVERDMDDGEEIHHEYVMRYCPNCKAKIEGGVNDGKY